MKKWLETEPKDRKTDSKYAVYMNRIQKRIDKELDALLWLAIHYPQLFLDEEREWSENSGKIMSHRRLKKMLLALKNLNPKCDVELVLRRLDFPDKEELPQEQSKETPSEPQPSTSQA